jgi:hypothetical protein
VTSDSGFAQIGFIELMGLESASAFFSFSAFVPAPL